MSKLQELIQQYCPDGVEYDYIGNLIQRERAKGKSDTSVFQVMSVSAVFGVIPNTEYRDYDLSSDDTSNYTIVRKGMFAYNPSRLNIGSFNWNRLDVDGLVSPIYVVFSVNESRILKEYLYLYMTSSYVKRMIEQYKEEGARFRFDFNNWNKIQIPVPPLEVQAEIVRILDTFTELQTKLEEELTARQKQYEYYRDSLLNFNHKIRGVQWVELGEVALVSDYVANGSFADLRNNVSYKNEPDYAVLVRTVDFSNNFDKDKLIYIDEQAYNFLKKSQLFGGEIIINNIGAGVGSTFRCPYLNTKMNLAPNSIMVKTSNDPFYYYWFKSKYGQEAIKKITSKSAMPKFNKTGFRSIKIPVPPLDVQQRIVEVLDNFEKICTDLKIGLPAEINARKQQYEYYRDKLLTFERKN